MTGIHRILSIVLVLSMVSISIPVPAQNSTPYYIANRQQLDVPIVDEGDVDCKEFDGCPEEARGISFLDYHVGPEIEIEEDEDIDLVYVFYSTANVEYWIYYYELMAYDLCTYNEAKEALGCHEVEGDWVVGDDLHQDTEYLRVILRQGALGEYTLQIWGLER